MIYTLKCLKIVTIQSNLKGSYLQNSKIMHRVI
ncbi:hypothetical protein SAST42_02684 [Staphylococcus aureus]|nr:hypothetical protein SAST42_02684 [Staphylococcus aureus]AMV86348.1 hypothetical protein SAST43_02677 [Staphylococcus aureus]EJE56922.1 hypothetical protein Newbould305_0491 [Staphylococcus aureus subsp. aureus str. Newbould 305]